MLRKTWLYSKYWPVVLLVGCGGADPTAPALAMCKSGQQALLLGHIVNSALGAVIATFAGRMVKQSQ